jgi:hypothetical protein
MNKNIIAFSPSHTLSPSLSLVQQRNFPPKKNWMPLDADLIWNDLPNSMEILYSLFKYQKMKSVIIARCFLLSKHTGHIEKAYAISLTVCFIIFHCSDSGCISQEIQQTICCSLNNICIRTHLANPWPSRKTKEI